MPPAAGYHPSRTALIVEDERPIRELLRLHLEGAGFAVSESEDGSAALRLLRNQAFDLIVLDVMLPGLDGISLCQAVRRDRLNTHSPILMITARDAESDKVSGLESGADDYIAKPFGVREFLARVGAVMRRHKRETRSDAPEALTLSAGPLHLDSARRQATIRGESVELTPQEFDLLHRLASRRGIVFSRAALLKSVWKDDVYVTERTVDTVVSRLRHKIERDPRDPELILTAWGIGYKFADGG